MNKLPSCDINYLQSSAGPALTVSQVSTKKRKRIRSTVFRGADARLGRGQDVPNTRRRTLWGNRDRSFGFEEVRETSGRLKVNEGTYSSS